MIGRFIDVGADVFQFTKGMVLKSSSAARAEVVIDLNYKTGRIYLEPYRGCYAILRVWSRVSLALRKLAWSLFS